jgi:uncharacterized protein YkwD
MAARQILTIAVGAWIIPAPFALAQCRGTACRTAPAVAYAAPTPCVRQSVRSSPEIAPRAPQGPYTQNVNANASGNVQLTATDSHGFVGMLNRIRAAAGLRPVAYDPNLSAWASRNNAAQSTRGLGHHVNPGCRQNSGWNYPDVSSVTAGWMGSPGHRAAMLAPEITRVGIAYGPGPYWTMNAR